MSKPRLRRAPAEREQLVEQQRVSGLSVEAFCAEHSIGKSTFAKWKRQISSNANRPDSAFRPVRLVEPAPQTVGSGNNTTLSVSIGAVTHPHRK